MKPVDDTTRAKVFTQYLPYFFDSHIYYGILKAIEEILNGTNTQHRIILNPLHSITKKDLNMVATLQGFNASHNDFSIFLYDGEFKWDDGNQWGRIELDKLNFKAHQYLLSKGYDLPNPLLDGKNLQDAGIATYT